MAGSVTGQNAISQVEEMTISCDFPEPSIEKGNSVKSETDSKTLTSLKAIIHFNELLMEPGSETRQILANHIRVISENETYLVNFNEMMKTIHYDETLVERVFYKRATNFKYVEGEFQIIKNNGNFVTIPRRSEPKCDMVLFLCLFVNRGTSIDVASTTTDKTWNDMLIYKKKQYKIRNSISLNEKPEHLSLAKLASCKPQVITYLCHLNYAKFIIELDFLGDVPKSMQHTFFAGIVPKTKSYQSLLYYCFLFTLLWFRKILKYPEKDVSKEKIEEYVRTCHSGYLDNIERLIIMHSLHLIHNGVPSKVINDIGIRSKLCWKCLDLFTQNKKLFVDLLKRVPNRLSFKQQLKWIRNHSNWKV